MTPSEFRKFYIALVRLNGVVTSDTIIEVINKFEPTIKKKDLYKDLNKRLDKCPREYIVRKIARSSKYIVQFPYIEDYEIGEIFALQRDKPLYIPDTKEELFEYVKDWVGFYDKHLYYEKDFDFEEKIKYIKDNIIVNDKNVCLDFRLDPHVDGSKNDDYFSKIFGEFDFKDDYSYHKSVRYAFLLLQHHRTWQNRGYSFVGLQKLENPGFDILKFMEKLENLNYDLEDLKENKDLINNDIYKA